jgi:hypothetical protein
MRHPDDLIARYGSALKPNTVMFCGTLWRKRAASVRGRVSRWSWTILCSGAA